MYTASIIALAVMPCMALPPLRRSRAISQCRLFAAFQVWWIYSLAPAPSIQYPYISSPQECYISRHPVQFFHRPPLRLSSQVLWTASSTVVLCKEACEKSIPEFCVYSGMRERHTIFACAACNTATKINACLFWAAIPFTAACAHEMKARCCGFTPSSYFFIRPAPSCQALPTCSPET